MQALRANGRPQGAASSRPSRTPLRVRAAAVYVPPSQRLAANELGALSRLSSIVPDTLLLETPVAPKAATVSSQVLKGVLASSQLGLKPFMTAIENSLKYDKCLSLSGDARSSCQLDKAMANVGAMLAGQVEGRVATELDPRLANDKDALVARAHSLLALYKENGVQPSKLIFRVPATWAGIQAAAELEREGTATQVFHIYSLVQGIAAAQAGVSVIQPNVGRTRDWYNKHPGVIRDPHGPREDSGFASRVDPGLQLVRRLYGYVKARHPKTQIMASGIRSKDDALALAGCDYLVLSARVMADLEGSPTLQGYNSGFSATNSADDEGVPRGLSPDALSDDDEVPALGQVDEEMFKDGLGLAASELLAAGVAGMVADVKTVLPYFSELARSAE
ncbi:transaldolase [Raphidocelis subcapitata]|uniref:Transaldolase n=1 Tax=Raphidocelis subcapitata TaxID=307507 RepID=A0A2V0PPF9_9CHLO|nr:transaldolase [Raphidocelis subcapitata]|eukprot:GBG00054.1 transaldolase [Raphidocelis subcapitata]